MRISVDGVSWEETAILRGPGGEEQVSVDDIVVTDREYLLTGEAWTNTATGSEGFHNVLWRSSDGATWTSLQLDELVANARAARLVAASPGLVLAGMVHDSETGMASPRLWMERAGEWVDLSSGIPGFDQNGWIEGAAPFGDGMLLWGTRDQQTFIWSTADFDSWARGVIGGNNARIRQVAAVGGGLVAVGSRGTWVSDDAVTWMAGAVDDDLGTDGVSEGDPGFGRLFGTG